MMEGLADMREVGWGQGGGWGCWRRSKQKLSLCCIYPIYSRRQTHHIIIYMIYLHEVRYRNVDYCLQELGAFQLDIPLHYHS